MFHADFCDVAPVIQVFFTLSIKFGFEVEHLSININSNRQALTKMIKTQNQWHTRTSAHRHHGPPLKSAPTHL